MRPNSSLFFILLTTICAIHASEESVLSSDPDYLATCNTIEASVSNASAVFYPRSTQYAQDISHYFQSSSRNSTCAVEPGTAEDVAIILRIVGQTRTPFAVKSGGHASNPGFSSTPGVQITTKRFDSIQYDATSQTVSLGTGLIWDDVYAAFDSLGINCLGGRVVGIGVAGFILGGGYSWQTNQHGLAVDTVVEFEVVLPGGDIVTATDSSYPDLFFALKGGSNNLGIVTKVVMRAFPQGPIWGGLIFLSSEQYGSVVDATANFAATVTDPKAVVLPSFLYTAGMLASSVILFYDGPTPPPGVFEQFLAIPALSSDISTRSFLSFFRTLVSPAHRGVLDTVPVVDYSPVMLDAMVNETIFWSHALQDYSLSTLLYSVEPFLPSILSHNTSPSAYPPRRDVVYLPTSITFGWTDPSQDSLFIDSIMQTYRTLRIKAAAEGQPVTPAEGYAKYGNYAIASTPLEQIYGDNLPELQRIKRTYDPDNVMGLTGGWKF
ncbi:FAD-binding domain-containing protein [Punctularia strigosozonata HHB-11173 SS5]|uniref:FAD-binding domain-containing protein n=1 Tax=Punctularia strigosozonata (strain HHB-11173) TaxID=741275 RepID=UPI00044181FB|nr:FAD-binding domain-containing protein [Punctularia strigosozonata HHB-11173 SS5]EIN13665.1 FAD-binding domain-containing protein [Punctularia strigosozonata HHB-11173 SS5]